jgi:hypothetical protein
MSSNLLCIWISDLGPVRMRLIQYNLLLRLRDMGSPHTPSPTPAAPFRTVS